MITIAIRLQSDYNVSRAPASNSTQPKTERRFFVIVVFVVISQLNWMHIVISITSVVLECIVISSYRSRIVVELQLWYRLKNRDLQSVQAYLGEPAYTEVTPDKYAVYTAYENQE